MTTTSYIMHRLDLVVVLSFVKGIQGTVAVSFDDVLEITLHHNHVMKFRSHKLFIHPKKINIDCTKHSCYVITNKPIVMQ